MTDKSKTEQWAGSHLNDPKPRHAGRIPLGGYEFQVSPTEGPDPAPLAKGHDVPSVRHVRNQG